jgi:hypothetical protein
MTCRGTSIRKPGWEARAALLFVSFVTSEDLRRRFPGTQGLRPDGGVVWVVMHLGFVGTRDRVRPAGSAASGSAQDAATAAVSGWRGPMRLSWCTQPTPRVSRQSPVRANLGGGPRRPEPGPARTSSSSPPLQKPQRRGRSFTDPETSSSARPTCRTRRTPRSWGWTT